MTSISSSLLFPLSKFRNSSQPLPFPSVSSSKMMRCYRSIPHSPLPRISKFCFSISSDASSFISSRHFLRSKKESPSLESFHSSSFSKYASFKLERLASKLPPSFSSRFQCNASSSSGESVELIEKENSILPEPITENPSKKALAYPFPEIESKWQMYWETHKTFRTPDEIDTSKPKYYVLDMFPYPSGSGLHVGHPEGYTATDILARYKRMKGYNVLHPMGWDAFGLPAEQYAIETGTHPRETTLKNIDRFRTQLKSLGFSYDWDREISTTDPDYYKWTQWIFLQIFNRGLAYQAEIPVNWCPALGTVLANEEVINGLSERGNHPVIRKPMKQWMLKITEYADRLLEDLDGLDWPENIKEMQRNWIGRSEGAEVDFAVAFNDGDGNGDAGGHDVEERGEKTCIRVYTTRPDTLCGATYIVIAPEHPLVSVLTTESQKEDVEKYVDSAKRKSDLERTDLQKTKSGIFSGSYSINPINGEKIPIWIADYVLSSYGTGAIMAVPAHDSRDFEFAKKFELPIRHVILSESKSTNPIAENEMQDVYSGNGVLVNSQTSNSGLVLNGLTSTEAKEKIISWLEENKMGKKQVNYKLRDWLFARQRYWGEPFPIYFREGSSNPLPLQEKDLPLTLPEMDDFSPSGTGEPPLSKASSWVNIVDPLTGEDARRETNTMPQWAGSCWYYLRFMDPSNSNALVDTEKEKYWGPVDLYVGGSEHSVLHLLYARFWHKVLYDIGVVSTKEPFQCLVNQGMILGEVEYMTYKDANGNYVSADVASKEDEVFHTEKLDESDVLKSGESYVLKSHPSVRVSAKSHKMSKSRGNVINPDDVVSEFGADSLRLYEMFMGPLKDTKIWNTRGVEGVHRFLARSWRLITQTKLGLDTETGAREGGEEAINGVASHSNGSGVVVTGNKTDPSYSPSPSPSLPETIIFSSNEKATPEQLKAINQCVAKVTEELENMRFNTAISTLMEFVNAATKWNNRPKWILETFVLVLAPLAPHIAEEMWQKLGNKNTLAYEKWPIADESYLVEEMIKLPVQVNGKMKGLVEVSVDAEEGIATSAAMALSSVEKAIQGKSLKKKIYVKGRILNFIVA